MKKIRDSSKRKHFFERMAAFATQTAGSNVAIVTAFSSVLLWLIWGPFAGFSQEWQMVMNSGTTIMTFLMVFLIQKSQNKDSLAIQLKLNELLAAHELASNKLVDVENMTEEELKIIQKYYSNLRVKSKKEASQQSHSFDDAKTVHEDINSEGQKRKEGN